MKGALGGERWLLLCPLYGGHKVTKENLKVNKEIIINGRKEKGSTERQQEKVKALNPRSFGNGTSK